MATLAKQQVRGIGLLKFISHHRLAGAEVDAACQGPVAAGAARLLARGCRLLATVAKCATVLALFPLFALAWTAVALDRMQGRTAGAALDAGRSSELDAPLGAALTEQRRWLADMEYCDRF